MSRSETDFRVLDWLLKFLPGSSYLSPPSTTADMSPTTDAFAVFDHPSLESANTEPSRMSDSYFPRSHRSSFSSNTSSVMADASDAIRSRPDFPTLRPAQPTRAYTTAASVSSATPKAVALDALSRHFPKPAQESSVEEMLARPPQKWSLGAYVKSAREARAPVQDKEQQARAFADTKKELLAAKEALQRGAAARR